MSEGTTFASGRYSKRKRTQVNYRMEEMDVDETENEWEEEEAVKPKVRRFSRGRPAALTFLQKQRRTAASRPLPKHKVFPFLELPAEIRNMIYSYALTDALGMKFVAVQRHRRRCVERVSSKTFSQVLGHRSYYHSNTINDDADEQAAVLVPSLLAVNKQTYQEGRDFLYGNELIFADTIALYAFMINLGPAGACHLKKIRLTGWGHGRTSKAYNNACFAVLVWATNLEKFYIDSTINWCTRPKTAAQQIYRDAFPWLEAVGHAKHKLDAALDVLELSEVALWGGRYGNPGTSDAQMRKMFNEELSRNLTLQQKRVMNKTTKKRTASKVSNKS
ncbi:hypothetical protein OPT61_g4466 [Boeremia exigua]|uniref:Uncharacterized protein n=1 Tax=Boeremia exigua TaxID=749465 RepID=A0ACC2IE05_9PLEO|nr:hypothetical protein OPT61_g4466 [Boeremia exigua]